MRFKAITSIPFIIATIVIFWVSHQPKIELPDVGIFSTDKILHFIVYFCYTILFITFLIGNFKLNTRKIIIIALIYSIFFAISDEIHQSFIPGRDASIYDFIADCIGILFAVVLTKKVENIIDKLKFYLILP